MSKASSKSRIELFVIEKVKSLRENAKISQSELAFKLGVSNGFIGQVESAKFPAKYNLDHIDKLAKIFHCSPKDLLPDQPLNKDSEESL
ncbi:helix-turn-helix transcriptional regulator [Pedobacter sp. MC2016-15]|uniref:helix-turn-helix domain-containing protein n=1 Tax=Pedobacter sp. MC2016-15 TaxID=2994473 RepID=UPI0022471BF4|nr:helix-turn-helix transcriptional regulator [Pedobacter sp. MC2016-15]MCX2481047.1 helix-turn-helix transcriptional regulator [Pedobacter sp. MC2016-15]